MRPSPMATQVMGRSHRSRWAGFTMGSIERTASVQRSSMKAVHPQGQHRENRNRLEHLQSYSPCLSTASGTAKQTTGRKDRHEKGALMRKAPFAPAPWLRKLTSATWRADVCLAERFPDLQADERRRGEDRRNQCNFFDMRSCPARAGRFSTPPRSEQNRAESNA